MRERIIAAFTELSLAKGFYNVTMDELAGQAGISKRTVYRYFKSKEEIINAVLDNFMSDAAGGIEQIIARENDPAGILTEVVKHFASLARSFITPQVLKDLRVHYPHLWQKIERFRAEKIQIFIKLLMDKRNAGCLLQTNPRIFATAFLASIQAVVNPEFILDNELTFEETTRQLVELFIYGLAGNNR